MLGGIVRTGAAAVLGLMVGGFIAFGRSQTDIFGIYDRVPFTMSDLRTTDGRSGWLQLKPDGTRTAAIHLPNQPQPIVIGLGEEKDGRISFKGSGEYGLGYGGSICGKTFTVESPDGTKDLHKPR